MSQFEMELIEKALGLIICCVFIYVIKPLINVLVTKYQNNEVVQFAITAIRAAEQGVNKDECEKKKAEVLDKVGEYVSAHTKLELTGKEIDTIIEGSMREAKEIYNKESAKEA